MSKYTQIDIKLVASYGGEGLRGAFPNLRNLLNNYGYDLVVAREPSLYDMVEVLVSETILTCRKPRRGRLLPEWGSF